MAINRTISNASINEQMFDSISGDIDYTKNISQALVDVISDRSFYARGQG